MPEARQYINGTQFTLVVRGERVMMLEADRYIQKVWAMEDMIKLLETYNAEFPLRFTRLSSKPKFNTTVIILWTEDTTVRIGLSYGVSLYKKM